MRRTNSSEIVWPSLLDPHFSHALLKLPDIAIATISIGKIGNFSRKLGKTSFSRKCSTNSSGNRSILAELVPKLTKVRGHSRSSRSRSRSRRMSGNNDSMWPFLKDNIINHPNWK